MPDFETYDPGTPCWVDLMSPDVDASVAFYCAVFGWQTSDEHDDEGNRIYTQFRIGAKVVAGLSAQPDGMPGLPPVWNTYISVDDVAATTAAVAEAGGTVLMPPMQVMSAGQMAICADPAGAAFSVWQAGEHRGANIANDPDTWSWNELLSRDLPAAQQFYTSVFGWEYDDVDMPDGRYHVIRGGEFGGRGGLMDMPSAVPDVVPSHWMVYFTTADIAATTAKIETNGGTIGQGPFPVPGIGTVAVVHDNVGATFSVLQPESLTT